MNGDLLVRNGTVVTNTSSFKADILIQKGVIISLGQSLSHTGLPAVDASGCFVLPGVIDPHVQFEVIHTSVSMTDDFDTGTKAAACGGVTTIIDFADQPRGVDAWQYLRDRKAVADAKVNIDYTLHMSITDLSGDTLAEISKIVQEESVPSFKLYLTYRQMGRMVNDGEVYAIMKKVASVGGIVGVHAEADALVEYLTEDLIRTGRTDPFYFPQSRPAVVEAISVAGAIGIARATGCDLYVHHVSTASAIEQISAAKREGVRVWAETCPHYLLLTEEVYVGDKARLFIMKPPLRTKADQDRLWKAVKTGEVDTIGTDHCSYLVSQKTKNNRFDQVPPGVPGVETLLPVMYTEGVAGGRITLPRLVELLSLNPARIFGLLRRKGMIAIGSDGDLVIFDPQTKWTLRSDRLQTNADFSPFEGMPLCGKVRMTILRGEIVSEDGKYCGSPRGGRFVPGSVTR